MLCANFIDLALHGGEIFDFVKLFFYFEIYFLSFYDVNLFYFQNLKVLTYANFYQSPYAPLLPMHLELGRPVFQKAYGH